MVAWKSPILEKSGSLHPFVVTCWWFLTEFACDTAQQTLIPQHLVVRVDTRIGDLRIDPAFGQFHAYAQWSKSAPRTFIHIPLGETKIALHALLGKPVEQGV